MHGTWNLWIFARITGLELFFFLRCEDCQWVLQLFFLKIFLPRFFSPVCFLTNLISISCTGKSLGIKVIPWRGVIGTKNIADSLSWFQSHIFFPRARTWFINPFWAILPLASSFPRNVIHFSRYIKVAQNTWQNRAITKSPLFTSPRETDITRNLSAKRKQGPVRKQINKQADTQDRAYQCVCIFFVVGNGLVKMTDKLVLIFGIPSLQKI